MVYYVIERIERICRELDKNIYKDSINIDNYKYIDGNYHNINNINTVSDGWVDFKTNDLWGGKDQHGWFKCSIVVPENFKGKTIALNFSTFKDGWDATNPQFLLYVNGEYVQGLDLNHTESILTKNAVVGTKYDIDLHAYAGMLADKKASLNGKLVVVDTDTRNLYWDLKVPIDVCKELEKDDKRRIDMLSLLNDAINLIDLRKPKSEEYSNSVKKASLFLQEKFYNGICGHEDAIATCVGHTHIDVAWLWTVAQTREKVARSFSTVLKLMEEYPEYIFMSSQPQLYEMLKEDHPEIYEQVKEKIKQGVWETEGAMWVESDCNVTSGESLVRQILHGKRFFKEEFGVDNKILWLPDVFGYSAAIPQILNKCDMDYFMTTKIAWNQLNKIPNDTFMWQGIDGSEVLTHFITTTGPNQSRDSFFTTYNGHIQPDAVMGAWRRYQNKDLTNDVLVSFGWGDGGGGATLEMLENARRLEKGIPGAPRVKMGKALDFFDSLHEKVRNNKHLPKWVGELYLEYHRGTYTSMARNKRDNRACENLYTAAEKLNSFNMVLGYEYPQDNINKSWKTILLNQFHDIIPGSSIKEVYDVTNVEYKELLSNVDTLLSSGINTLSSNIKLDALSVIVTNTLGFDRDDIAEFDIPENIKNPSVIDENGVEIVCQKTNDNKAIFFAKSVPQNGFKCYKIIEAKTNFSDVVHCTINGAENKFIKFMLDDKGQIISFINKLENREILKHGSIGNQFLAFEDKPMCFDNWDIDIYYKEKMWKIDDIQSIKVIEQGPVRSIIEINRKFLDSIIVQQICIYNDLARVDFKTYADWKEIDVLLKTSFPVDLNTSEATYEIQYGNVTRPTHDNTSWNTAMFEVCGHKWADLSEGSFGVSLLNNCKYGHDIKDGNMRLTLIKSTCDPNPDADKEEHFFTYSLYTHQGNWKDAKTVSQAYQINTPLFTKIEQPHDGALCPISSLVNVDKENICIEVIKKAEDSEHIIVRIYEFENKRVNANLTFLGNICEAIECNLLERDLKIQEVDGNQISFTIKPYEIKTFKVLLKI